MKLFFNLKLTNFKKNNIIYGIPPLNCKNTLDISLIKIWSTWKTTYSKRHLKTDSCTTEYINQISNPTVIELGMSSGSSILDYLNIIVPKCEKIYLSDILLTCFHTTINNWNILISADLKPFMAWNKRFIVYSDYTSYNFILNFLSKSILCHFSKKINEQTQLATLNLVDSNISSAIVNNSNIKLKNYSVLDNWCESKVDLVRSLNLFNNDYFNLSQKKLIVHNVFQMLKEKGILVIGHNRDEEYFSVYSKSKSGFKLIEKQGNYVDFHEKLIGYKNT